MKPISFFFRIIGPFGSAENSGFNGVAAHLLQPLIRFIDQLSGPRVSFNDDTRHIELLRTLTREE